MPSIEIPSGSADSAPQASPADIARHRSGLDDWTARQANKTTCDRIVESCQMGALLFLTGAATGAAMAAIGGQREIPLLTTSMISGSILGLFGVCYPDPKPGIDPRDT